MPAQTSPVIRFVSFILGHACRLLVNMLCWRDQGWIRQPRDDPARVAMRWFAVAGAADLRPACPARGPGFV
jgi:hypothetical protein